MYCLTSQTRLYSTLNTCVGFPVARIEDTRVKVRYPKQGYPWPTFHLHTLPCVAIADSVLTCIGV